MAQTTKNDELNIIGDAPKAHKRMAIPFEEYFDAMDIEEYQKQKRIFIAEDLSAEMMRVFGLMAAAMAIGKELDNFYWSEVLQDGYLDAIGNLGYDTEDDFYQDHIRRASNSIIDTTVKNEDDDWYFSEDRADYLSEDEANTIANYDELQEAIESGMTHKTWVTERDGRVRKTHRAVDGTTLPIAEPFEVGGYQMMMPRDDTLGAGAEEIVMCRCTLQFSQKWKQLLDNSNNSTIITGESATLYSHNTSDTIGERYRVGNPVEPIVKTYEHALDPLKYVYDVVERFGINLRGSGKEIEIVLDYDLGSQAFGKTTKDDPTVIRLNPNMFYDDATVANTVAHELNHARSFLKGGNAEEAPAYLSGDKLEEYIRGER